MPPNNSQIFRPSLNTEELQMLVSFASQCKYGEDALDDRKRKRLIAKLEVFLFKSGSGLTVPSHTVAAPELGDKLVQSIKLQEAQDAHQDFCSVGHSPLEAYAALSENYQDILLEKFSKLYPGAKELEPATNRMIAAKLGLGSL